MHKTYDDWKTRSPDNDNSQPVADDIIELSACVDCVVWLANGEEPHDNPDGWSPDQIEANWAGYQVVVGGDESTEYEFSWQPCDVCGSRLGGDRYPCNAWKCD